MVEVLLKYGLEETAVIERITGGLINETWKVSASSGVYILQRINERIFTNPEDIAYNIRLVANYLREQFPTYYFVSPLSTPDGRDIICIPESGYYRLFNYVKDSHVNNVVTNRMQAYQASQQFARFTQYLSGFDAKSLRITIPHFHDLTLRYEQFCIALVNANKERLSQSKALIKVINTHEDIVSQYKQITNNSGFKLRVMHHDTKISNVLFNSRDEGICVIDLDTIMPGYIISDVGDMMRTYLSPVNEEESNFDKIQIRTSLYKAIVKGYTDGMDKSLFDIEKEHFFYAGKFMIYMQALRFLTDHLNDDKYYGVTYPGQNFVRAGNQLMLLQRLMEKEDVLRKLI